MYLRWWWLTLTGEWSMKCIFFARTRIQNDTDDGQMILKIVADACLAAELTGWKTETQHFSFMLICVKCNNLLVIIIITNQIKKHILQSVSNCHIRLLPSTIQWHPGPNQAAKSTIQMFKNYHIPTTNFANSAIVAIELALKLLILRLKQSYQHFQDTYWWMPAIANPKPEKEN
jgi:hypothetical protein